MIRTEHLPMILSAAIASSSLSCTSSTLTASWSDSGYKNRPIASVLVLGVSKDQTARRRYEDTFVAQLRQIQVSAVAGYTQLPSSDKPDRAAIEAAVKITGVSAVLITRVVGVDKRTRNTPPMSSYSPGPYHRGMYGYYSRTYDDVHAPSYFASYEVHKLASDLYDSATGALIWSAQSETVDPVNLAKEIDGLVRLLIDDLRKKDLL